jgi:hypothetical protein
LENTAFTPKKTPPYALGKAQQQKTLIVKEGLEGLKK